MSFSAPDHPVLGALLGDAELAAHLSFEADWRAMLAFEAALAAAEAEHGLVPVDAAERIAAVCASLAPEMAALAKGAARDGVVVVELVKRLRAAVGEPHAKSVHVGATSQDVIDTSLVLRLKPAAALLDARLAAIVASLEALRARDGAAPLTAHTRMQRALPFTATDKIDAWIAPLRRHRERLPQIAKRLFIAQLGGPIGVRGDFGGHGDAVAASLARRLGLEAGPVWQTARDSLAEFAHWLAAIAGALGKIGQDVALLTQNEVAEARLAGGGASSAMAHKSNPVRAEVLVALARHAATLAGGFNQSLIHEYERSGAAWTLEWLTLPPLLGAAGAATRHAISLCGDLSFAAGR